VLEAATLFMGALAPAFTGALLAGAIDAAGGGGAAGDVKDAGSSTEGAAAPAVVSSSSAQNGKEAISVRAANRAPAISRRANIKISSSLDSAR
jgi:hypothetical protein